MRIAPRYWIPALLALLLVAGIALLLAWHVRSSVSVIEQAASLQEKGRMVIPSFLQGTPPPVTGDETEALRFLREGEVHALQGELRKAEEALQESVRAGGGIPALRKLAHVQLQRRNFTDARQTIARLKREGANPQDTLLLEGSLELRRGNIGTARQILQDGSATPQGQYGLALLAIALGEHASAKEHLRFAAQGADPVIRSQATILLGAYDEFALFEDGRDIHLATLISRALAQVQECEVGLKLLQHVVTQKSGYRDAWIVKGYCELISERYTEALASLEEAYNIDPEKPETQYFLARTYFLLDDPRNAVTFLQYAIVNGFEPAQDARLLLARYALELGNAPLALEQYLALTEEESSTVSAFERYIALALSIQGMEERAYGAAKVAISRWPDDPHAITLMAQAAFAYGLVDEARQHLDRALRLNPSHDQARALLEEMQEQ